MNGPPRARFATCPLASILAILWATTPAHAIEAERVDEIGTFSVVAWDSITGELGVAVQSRAFSVGPAVAWAEAGVGAIATQASTNESFGPRGLELLRLGLGAAEARDALIAADEGRESRQLGVVDARGSAAAHTGTSCLDWAGSVQGPGFTCQGNILAGQGVVENMAQAMRTADGELADRLLAALDAAQAAGGDKRGKQSAAILVVRHSDRYPEYNTRYVDLRVEDHPEPIQELHRVYAMAQAGDLTEAHLRFAEEYDSTGVKDRARRERDLVGRILENVLATGSKDPNVLNNLAWAVATHDMYLPEAKIAAERAVEAAPGDAGIIDTLAEVLYRMGDVKGAIATEERAVKIDPKSAYLKEQIARFKGGKKKG